MPRFLARLPYGARTNPVEEFDFEEQTDGPDAAEHLWANAAYAMAANIPAPSNSTAGACASGASTRAASLRGFPC